MTDRTRLPLDKLAEKIYGQLADAGFSPGTIGLYKRFFGRLIKMADALGKEVYDQDLAYRFIGDNAYRKGGGYCHSRYLYHVRCIRFIESYISDGVIDWGITHHLPAKELKTPAFRLHHSQFKDAMQHDGLKQNTMDGYLRFVYYFLSYLEDKGYASLSQIRKGDITFFMVLVCQEHYSPTSLGAHLTGLRRFVHMFPELDIYAREIPDRIPKKGHIIPVYTDEEHEKIDKCLAGSGMSERNRAIALIAFETGLRAVDICKLKLDDIGWKHDVIRLEQEKTGKTLTIPIRPSLGNALAAYLPEERPQSASAYVSSVALHRSVRLRTTQGSTTSCGRYWLMQVWNRMAG